MAQKQLEERMDGTNKEMLSIKELLPSISKSIEKLMGDVKEMSIGKGKEVSTLSVENSNMKRNGEGEGESSQARKIVASLDRGR